MYPSPSGLAYGQPPPSMYPPPAAPPPVAPYGGLQRQNSLSIGGPAALLKLVDEFRLDAPVSTGQLSQRMNTPQRQFDFTMERQMLDECSSNFSDTLLASVPVEELGGQHPAVASLVQMGFTAPCAYLAMALYGNRSDQDQLVEFCKNYQQMMSMGFEPAQIVGALKKTGNDVAAAIDLLG